MKLSIYAGPAFLAAIEGFENRSERIETICDRYAAMIGGVNVEGLLTKGEIKALAVVVSGINLGDVSKVVGLWAVVAESPVMSDPARSLLSAKLRDMPIAARMALAELLERRP